MALWHVFRNVFSGSKLEIIEFYQEKKLLKMSVNCPKCESSMKLSPFPERQDGYIWRCPVRRCRASLSVRCGSFFEKSKESLRDWLMIILEWSREIPATYTSDMVDITNKTACRMYQYLRDVCSWKLLNSPCLLGGPGCVVQIDESCVSKRQKVWLSDLGLGLGLWVVVFSSTIEVLVNLKPGFLA